MDHLPDVGPLDLPAPVREAIDAERVGATIGDNSRILEANDHYLRLIGFSRAELEAGEVSWLRLTPPEWLAADARLIGELRASGRGAAYEKEYARRDGTHVRVRIAARLLTVEPLRIFAVVAAAGDLQASSLVDAVAA